MDPADREQSVGESTPLGRQTAAKSKVDPTRASVQIGLVSYDFSGKSAFECSTETWPPAYHEINCIFDQLGCTAVLYPLLPFRQSFQASYPEAPRFGEFAAVANVFAGATADAQDRRQAVAWERGLERRELTEVVSTKEEFFKRPDAVAGILDARVFGDALYLFGGELNAMTYRHKERRISDDSGIFQFLLQHQIRLVFNPASFYMRRWEIKFKRRYLSEGGAIVVSSWNKRAWEKPHFVGEAAIPWTVYRNDEDALDEVTDVEPDAHRLGPAIRLGVLTIPELKFRSS
jgi:hypothetical protein